MKTSIRECSIRELHPRLRPQLEQYLSANEEVLLCYEQVEPYKPNRYYAYLITNHRLASAFFLPKPGGMQNLFNRVAGIVQPEEGARMVPVTELASISEKESVWASGISDPRPYSIMVSGKAASTGIGFGFSYKDEFYNRVRALLVSLLDDANTNVNQGEIKPPVSERLRDLTRLHSEGLITDVEFAEKRKSLLDEL